MLIRDLVSLLFNERGVKVFNPFVAMESKLKVANNAQADSGIHSRDDHVKAFGDRHRILPSNAVA
jgi:hypothetical protein